jgi:hypothetical protein
LISHRKREVTEEGLRLDCGEGLWWTACFWAGKTRIGESIAQRSRRSQRRIEVRLRKALWWTAGFWVGKTPIGESIAQRSRRGIEVQQIDGPIAFLEFQVADDRLYSEPFFRRQTILP